LRRAWRSPTFWWSNPSRENGQLISLEALAVLAPIFAVAVVLATVMLELWLDQRYLERIKRTTEAGQK
jgi:hypothetical protein